MPRKNSTIGPEQVAHHLGCTGERHGHDGVQQAAHPEQCTGHAPAHRASDTDKCIFGRKSQSVQGLTYDENEAVLQQFLRKMIDVMLGPAAEAVPTQELHALELCPQERSFWPRFSAAAAQALRSAVPLSYLRSNGFLLPCRAAKLLCIQRGGGFHILCG